MSTSERPAMTLREYRLLPEEVVRQELLEGVLVREPSPTTKHQTVSRLLQYQLMTQLELPGLASVFDAPVDVVVDEHNVVQPDLAIVSSARASIITEPAIEGAPEIVVEILSPSTQARDRDLKRKLYARLGVLELWMVDVKRCELTAYALRDSDYVLRERYDRSCTLRCPLFPGLEVVLALVFK